MLILDMATVLLRIIYNVRCLVVLLEHGHAIECEA